MNLEIKRNIFQTIIYEIETEFNNFSTLSFVNEIKPEEEIMFTTFNNNQQILNEANLKDLKGHVEQFLDIFTKNVLEKNTFKITESWIQTYRKNGHHLLHVHHLEKNSYSLIFYIECTEQSSKTVFFCPGFPYTYNDSIKIIPKKSKFVIFPGHVPHEVEYNQDDQRIIFSCNFSIF